MNAGFVLVGGCSSRMGRDKALLRWNSRFMVEHVAEQVASAAGSVALVGDPERYGALGIDCLADLRPGLGPLAGIETALASNRGELNLIVACDMPGLTKPPLIRLLGRAEMNEAKCVVARDETGSIQPLCAVYSSSCLPAIRRALDARRLKVLDLIEELRAATIDLGERILNVNTPEEWDEWRESRYGRRSGQVQSHHGD